MTETTERIISEKHYDLELKKQRMAKLETAINEIASGEATVNDPLTLGMIISEYNAIERELRHGYAALYAKCNKFDKADTRSFFVGYYVDDEGRAIDPETKKCLESECGELLTSEPKKLALSSTGALPIEIGETYIGMITRNDTIAVKEFLSNVDVPRCDGINGLYMILGALLDWDSLDLPERMEPVKKLWQEIGKSVAKSALHYYKEHPTPVYPAKDFKH